MREGNALLGAVNGCKDVFRERALDGPTGHFPIQIC